jgi:uroporphyrinogen III methyltransferase/synthase
VRLKGGDPYVFGRGGEEAEALRAAGVPFEVVPGITAAIAAPCYAGIPVTHRDFNTSFTVITGHEKDEDDSRLDWDVIARLPCFAFYMGAKALPRICARLIEHGMDRATPAATIQWGTRAQQRTVTGTVADIANIVESAGVGSPAITIFGKVVSLRDTLNWFEQRPLFGQTVVVTRTRQQASELSEKLEALGADVIEAPTIELTPPADMREVDDALRTPSSDWVIFTSANGVAHTKKRLFELGLDARAFANAKIAAIGDATERAIREQLALQVDLCPQSFVAEALADELAKRNEIAGKRHLLLRADIARPVLRERLIAGRSALVRDVAVYETKRAASLPDHVIDAIEGGRATWVTFTSSSTAKNFVELLGAGSRERVSRLKIASIGPITTTTLRELGLTPTVEAKTFNVDGLVDALASAST